MKSALAISDPRVAKALSHPLRTQILFILEERRASPRALADELGVPIGNVSYHVRTLLGLNLIRLVNKIPRRGSVEHYYEAVAAENGVADDAWAELPEVAKKAVLTSLLQEVGRDVCESATLGGFERSGAHVSTRSLRLDDRGRRELAVELARLLERAETLERESLERLAGGGNGSERPSGLVLMLFDKLAAVRSAAATAAPCEAPLGG